MRWGRVIGVPFRAVLRGIRGTAEEDEGNEWGWGVIERQRSISEMEMGLMWLFGLFGDVGI